MRRAVIAVMAGALVVALAGCVGIPTSGGVNDGPLINDQDQPEFVSLPSDPIPGSSQQDILTDFMQAVSAPQGGYAVAKKFLTTSLAATWNPDASAIIRTGGFDVEQVADNTMTYTFSSRAIVNDLGQYQEERETSEQTLPFSFAQENGEWRISTAADGIVLSQAAFDVAFRQQFLYFFDPSYGYLVPDVRWFPSRQTTSRQVVDALLAGPSSSLQQVVTTSFPAATTLVALTTESGSTVVDLSTEALSSTDEVRDRMRQQLAATLDTQSVELTVRGLELVAPNVAGSRALVNPLVDPAVLVGTGTAFGFDGGTGVTPLTGLTNQVVAAGAVGAVLSSDKQTVAFLGAGGAVYAALAGDNAATVIDDRPGLTIPSVDPFRFIWSAQSSSAASLATFSVDGTLNDQFQSGLPADSSIVSLDVSRDGARLLLLLSTPVGPRLVVSGIVRQDNVPVGLGEPVYLPVDPATPLDATWVDDHTVATISAGEGGNALITAFGIGGKSVSLGRVQGAIAIAGGNGGADGLRVLTTSKDVWRPRGSEGWVVTGIHADFLATKQ